ncbi:MAG: maleate cis-trans isomerase family protein [Kiritimatiellia bacterium]
MPAISPSGPVLNGEPSPVFDVGEISRGHPDTCSYRRRFGLLLPATNTTMESELWSLIVQNRDNGLDGIGLHASPVLTPKPDVSTPGGIEQYRKHFLGGVKHAVESGLLAGPQYFIMGMSLEHIISGIEPIRATMVEIEQTSDLAWTTWHDAAKHALECVGAKRIGLITPFERTGNESATRMFTDLGFEVVASFGFACANTQHIAHIPNDAKERAIIELLATRENKLDAVVQCGTNMSMLAVTEKLEPLIGIPVLGINATLLWHALRENGIKGKLKGGGRLLRDG